MDPANYEHAKQCRLQSTDLDKDDSMIVRFKFQASDGGFFGWLGIGKKDELDVSVYHNGKRIAYGNNHGPTQVTLVSYQKLGTVEFQAYRKTPPFDEKVEWQANYLSRPVNIPTGWPFTYIRDYLEGPDVSVCIGRR